MKYSKPWEPTKVEEKGLTYNCGPVHYLTAPGGATRGDHIHPEADETIWLISGQAELHVEDEVEKLIAPCIVQIPGDKHHKLVALTDISFIEQRQPK